MTAPIKVDPYSPTPANLTYPIPDYPEPEPELTEHELEILSRDRTIERLREQIKSAKEALAYKVDYFEKEMAIMQVKLDRLEADNDLKRSIIKQLTGRK